MIANRKQTSGQGPTATLIQFEEGQAVMSNVVFRNPRSLEFLRAVDDPDQVALLLDATIAAVATLAKGTVTVSEFATAAKELLRQQVEELGKQAKANGQALEKAAKGNTELLEKATKAMQDNLRAAVEGLVKQATEQILVNNADVKKALGEKTGDLAAKFEKFFKERVEERLLEISRRFGEEQVELTARENNPSAGRTYQDLVHQWLSDALAQSSGSVHYVADAPGTIARCKVGDFVVASAFGPHEAAVRVVVEATDEDMSSPKQLDEVLAEMATAKRNRETHAGLYLFSARASMPKGLPPVKVGPDYVIATTEGNDVALLLDLARAVAALNLRLDRARRAHETLDVSGIRMAIVNLEKSGRDFDELHRLLGLAETHVKGASKIGYALKQHVSAMVAVIEAALRE